MTSMTDEPLARRWLRIMADPLSYLHESRLEQQGLPADPGIRAAVNDLLLQRYSLTSLPMPRADEPAIWFARQWDLLGPAMFLLGCHAARNSLPFGSAWFALPHHARRFASLPAGGVARPPAQGAVDERRVWQLGAERLMPFCSGLPEPLTARLGLLLPQDAAPFLLPGRSSVPQARDPVLLTMAIHHASRNLHRPYRFCG